MVTPAKQRKAAERQRMRDRGFVLRQLWVHPADWEAVREYVERKRKKRSALLNGVEQT
jgi:hypothetical protein